jgi:hypothetical protein
MALIFKSYSACQKNIPIADGFFCYNIYAAILFSEHYYDNRYKWRDIIDKEQMLLNLTSL